MKTPRKTPRKMPMRKVRVVKSMRKSGNYRPQSAVGFATPRRGRPGKNMPSFKKVKRG